MLDVRKIKKLQNENRAFVVQKYLFIGDSVFEHFVTVSELSY